LVLQGSDYPHAVQELNKAIDRVKSLLRIEIEMKGSVSSRTV